MKKSLGRNLYNFLNGKNQLSSIMLFLICLSCKTRQGLDSQVNDALPQVDNGQLAKNLFEEKCISCHNPTRKRGDLDLTDLVLVRRDFINATNPAQSDLYTSVLSINGATPRMPRGSSTPLTSQQTDLVLEWIREGAPAPRPAQAAGPTAEQIANAISQARSGFGDIQELVAYSCSSCHDSSTDRPWYAGIAPGVNGHIDNGRAAWDYADGFPSASASSLAEAFASVRLLENTIWENSMPLTEYTIAHPSTPLNIEEQSRIWNWTNSVQESFAQLDRSLESRRFIQAGEVCGYWYFRRDDSILGNMQEWFVDRRMPGCVEGTSCTDAGRSNARPILRCQ